MTKAITKEIYHEKVRRVFDHIHDNLDQELSFESLAEIAHLSPYHYHRIYRSIMGETVTQSIKRLRLQRAAQGLIKGTQSLYHIGKQAHYKNSDSFTRAFSEAYGIPPQAYRDKGQLQLQKITPPHPGDKDMYEVEILTLKGFDLATLDHRGDYMEATHVFEGAISKGVEQGLFTETTQVWGMYYDDPNTVPAQDRRSKAGFTFEKGAALKDGLAVTSIEGGSFARVLFKGPYNELQTPYSWIYGTWLLNNGHEPKDAPVIEEYLNSPHDTAPKDILTMIYIPLKGV